VQAFVNTNDIEGARDALLDAREASGWLGAAGLIDPAAVIDDSDAARLRRAREAIRELIAVNGGGAPTPAATAELADLAAGARARACLQDGRVRMIAEGGPVDAAIATMLIAIADATTGGTFGRLRVCENDGCRWAYYDHSKNARSRWCSAAVCGNRAHTRAYRARKAARP
jgi:predicted RNA-binding Zn ribbon-like protein